MGCPLPLVRLVWMELGSIALYLRAMSAAMGGAPVVTDVAFFGVATGVRGVPCVDIAPFKGHTPVVEPARLGSWQRPAVLSEGVWLPARGAA
jgi:hypothetical protein